MTPVKPIRAWALWLDAIHAVTLHVTLTSTERKHFRARGYRVQRGTFVPDKVPRKAAERGKR